MKNILSLFVLFTLICCFGGDGMAQNYDAVLESLQKLHATIQKIKQQYEVTNSEPSQYTDITGQLNEEDLNQDLMYDFAMNLEQLVADMTQVMTQAKDADAKRPKNPAAAGHGSITVTGYLHQQFYKEQGEDKSSFLSKRARLAIKGKLNNYASVKFMGEFAGTPKLLDGVMTIAPNKHWAVSFGQYKPPFGTEFLYPASNWPFVNTTDVKGLGTDRDIGTHVTYKNSASPSVDFALHMGVFNGSGYNKTDVNSDKNFVARGEFTFGKQFTIAPDVYIGKTNDTGTAKEDINTYGASATWKYKNEIIEGEYISSEVGSTEMYGWHVWAGHTIQTNSKFLPEIQLLARYAMVDEDKSVDNDATTCLTLGTNFFIDGKYTKLQLNYQINGEEGTSVDNNEVLLNLQVAF
ncbi:MAG: porin [Candidatus Zixiibacteriota bacterium]